MWLGWSAIALLLAGLTLLPSRRLHRVGMVLFCAGLICGPIAAARD